MLSAQGVQSSWGATRWQDAGIFRNVIWQGIWRDLAVREENTQRLINPLVSLASVYSLILRPSLLPFQKEKSIWWETHSHIYTQTDSTDSANEDQLVRELFPSTAWKQDYIKQPFYQGKCQACGAKQAEKLYFKISKASWFFFKCQILKCNRIMKYTLIFTHLQHPFSYSSCFIKETGNANDYIVQLTLPWFEKHNE